MLADPGAVTIAALHPPPLLESNLLVPENSSQAANSRLGLRLFFLYSLFYFGFVLVNAFAAEWSEWVLFGGLNLAIVWGFSLIGLAFLLAMIYGLNCTSDTDSTGQPTTHDEQQGSGK